ncbi:hypothetical protein PAHAL_2G043700 [Panicum hallii]|jgi:hypothetical protein|uniref:Uncharacterized protein n=1 Tax=Panicum hallii TaxID=206008 RepID=A0A2T8KMT9_9POAL|nr:hypothetical protein PAHAL_2G043700 [Panicum hallii]
MPIHPWPPAAKRRTSNLPPSTCAHHPGWLQLTYTGTLHSDYCSTAAYLDANVLVTHTTHQPSLINKTGHIFTYIIYMDTYKKD